MKEQLISFKTAKLAKEKGFDNDSENYYGESGDMNVVNGEDIFDAPTQSLLQKWLREVHEIYAYIDWHDTSSIIWLRNEEIVKTYNHTDLEKALQEALRLI